MWTGEAPPVPPRDGKEQDVAKRANGEGSISRRKDGRWHARLVVDGRRKDFYGRRRVDVERQLTQAKLARDRGIPIVGDDLTVARYLDQWLDLEVRHAVRASTLRSYEGHVRMYLKPRLGTVRLAKLSPGHVQRLMADLQSEGLSAQTVFSIRATLRRALNRAMKHELVHRNAAALADPPRVARPPVTVPTVDEARAILAAFEGHPLEAAVTVAMATGIRQGELLGLQWSDVDLDVGELVIRWALQRIDGDLRLVEPKTSRTRRRLYLPDVAIGSLRRHRAAQSRGRLAAAVA